MLASIGWFVNRNKYGGHEFIIENLSSLGLTFHLLISLELKIVRFFKF